MYIQRHMEKTLESVSKMFSAVIITGARQVGKTTMLRNYADDIRYLTLDDLQILNMARENTAIFFNAYKPPIIIDEIQYEPKLFHYIKMIADEKREKGLFFMTGSQSFHLMKNVTESLAGRVGILELSGLSYREIKGINYKKPFLPLSEHFEAISPLISKLDYWDIMEIIQKGSYPAIYEGNYDEEQTRRFFNDYLRTYIERDVRALSQVADENAFLKFITIVASLTAQQLNYTTIAEAVGKEVNTIKRWISILETSGIVYILQPYYENISKRLSKTPKIYFMDTGLACNLCGWYTPEQLAKGAMNGAIFETYVISEIIKSYKNYGRDTRLSFNYFRDRDGKEIDLIIEENGTLYPIEIKLTANPNKKDIKNFAVLQQSNKRIGKGGVVCMSEKLLYLDENNRIIPVNMI